MTGAQLRRLADKLAQAIARTQRRNAAPLACRLGVDVCGCWQRAVERAKGWDREERASMQLRKSNIDKLPGDTYDVLIIGGGINGAVAAAALAGKGVKTALIDRGDFAGFTSMNSSMRRRSKIALIVRKEDIKQSPGLMEACEILFGDQAQAKFDEYLQDQQQTQAKRQAAEQKASYPEVLSEDSHAENPAHSEALNW